MDMDCVARWMSKAMSDTEMKATEFAGFFTELCGKTEPFTWQTNLATSRDCGSRLIRIPTGFGKTLGVLAAWTWHRVQERNDGWPRRLIWCLPMRVLVEQTQTEARAALDRLGLLWDENSTHDGKIGVHLLMGGAATGQWHLYPECDSILIGTQDMLLSRAMNRGYASPRARWPMEFGLLNQDALWVMDEVQLMDVGLATSGQLQVFRNADRDANKTLRPCFTWWMSATLQHDWLEKSPDTADLTPELKRRTHRIEPKDRVGHLWDDVQKTIEIAKFKNSKALAKEISRRHGDLGHGKEGPTLVVLNTVERAIEVWDTLRKDKTLSDTDFRLVHSRFRPNERHAWRDEFLNRTACAPGTDRIIVSTQVVEAGVDISAAMLVTELAPWTSLVQRFGRCARWGGTGQIVVADFAHGNDKTAAPYTLDELAAAREACGDLHDVAPCQLEHFEERNAELLPRLYPYQPTHLLLRHELEELFDIAPDLSGADIDISRFIRSGDERDIQVFWMDVNGGEPSSDTKPTRDELCSVPFLKARDWLCKPKSENLKPEKRAWVWDWLNRAWREVKRPDLYPGQTVLVESHVGGYDEDRGWDPDAKDRVDPVVVDKAAQYVSRLCWKSDGNGRSSGQRSVRGVPLDEHADASEDDESLSITNGWQTIASHGLQVGREVERIANQVAPTLVKLLHLAGRWHDLGKAHRAFQGSIQSESRPSRSDIAKAPDIAWPCAASNMYRIDSTDQRRGFRHELASTLGLFGVLQRHDPLHQALLGPWCEWLGAINEAGSAFLSPVEDAAYVNPAPVEVTPIEQEILDLSAEEFDLVAYLVCAHHGKVRMSWHSSPADQKAGDTRLRIRGVREGDMLPPLPLAAADGVFHQLPASALDLSPSATGLSPRTGRSWAERVLNLVECLGPFTLAWLEAILRAADQRASGHAVADPLIEKGTNVSA